MEKLTDYMREDYDDVYHVFFPGIPLEQAVAQWNAFAQPRMQDFLNKVIEHIDGLRLPEEFEVVYLPAMPPRLLNDLAHSIDVGMPHWNLIQRTMLYVRCAKQLHKAAVVLLNQRVENANTVLKGSSFADEIISKALHGE